VVGVGEQLPTRYLVEEFAEEYRDGRLNRRELLRRVLLITGSAAVTANVLLALGCGTEKKAAVPAAGTAAAGQTAAAPSARTATAAAAAAGSPSSGANTGPGHWALPPCHQFSKPISRL
jgi:hypothetical protein